MVRFVLARLWPSLTLTGIVIRRAPASTARWAPFKFGANATMVQGRSRTARTTASVSAIAGTTLAGKKTKLPTSILDNPAATSAPIQPILMSVGMRVRAICNPSRGPTSPIVTHSPIARSFTV